jgi:hypothetical protein
LFFAGIEREKKDFYTKSRLIFEQIEIEYSRIDQKIKKENWKDLQSKKDLSKSIRNLEEKLFNLRILYFDQREDFSLKHFNFSDKTYLEKIISLKRVFVDGQRYVRTAEVFLLQESLTESQFKIYQKNRDLFNDSIQSFRFQFY